MFRDPQRIFGEEAARPVSVSKTLRRFTGYFKNYWPQYLLVLLMMIINTWTQVTAPELLGQAVDCFLTPATVGSNAEAVAPGFAEFMATTDSAAATNCTFADPQPDWTTADYLAGLGRIVLLILGI
ncbi:MAG: hypothetical protein R3335_14465, partial [Anaerolineales bacterium]|nr:hypothetical protein [Anaerolineales bacterium]